MAPRHRLFLFAFLLLIPLGAAGCAVFGGEAGPDPVSGSWTGAWYRAGEKQPAGPLNFSMTPLAPGRWRAVVEVSTEVEAIYELTLQGRAEGRRVLFEGEVDLGRAGGGVYAWSGEIAGDIFQGVFRHPSGDGRFELVRRPKPVSVVPPEDVSGARSPELSEP